VPDADDQIAFDVQGPGRIIGVDNGDPLSHEPFQSNQRRVFHGLCLAIVQSTRDPGQIEVTAAAPGLTPGHITIQTRRS
jgi:beta-galactosidase